MNPLIKKEIRLLLPAWAAAMALVIFQISIPVPFGFLAGAPDIGAPFGLILGFLLLSVASFGQELSSGSLASLLSQPMERRRIWATKIKMLAVAFVSVLFAWAVPKEIYFMMRLGAYPMPPNPDFPIGLEKHLILFALTMFSGGLWTTLLVRQVVASFALTLLVPLALDFSVGMVSGLANWPEAIGERAGFWILIAYSIAGFFWARRLFLQAQDTQRTGGNFIFPWRGRSVEHTASSFRLPRERFFALVWKEIHLHEANLFIAIILLVLYLASFVLHPILDRNVKRVFEFVWSLWLLMPLLIGCAAVAEERKLGVLESQLALAVSRRTQLLVKFFVALAFSIILGAVMPSVIERTRDFGIDWPHYWIFAGTAGIFAISFYASSFARTTLGAVGLALVVAVAIYLYETATRFDFLKWFPSGLDLLRFYLSIPILFFVLVGLASWNFKRLHQNRRLWQRNIMVVLVAGAAIPLLAAAIYFRPWELLLPLEPRGPVRIQDPAQVEFETSSEYGIDMFGNSIYSLSPAHRLWVERSAYYEVSNSLSSTGQSLVTVHVPDQRGQFIGGSNWVDFAVNDYATIAIQSDGTLWAIQGYGLTQIGADTNWSQVADGQDGFLLLKNDGSAWRWGTRIYYSHKGTSNPQVKLDVTSLPARVSDQTNWTALYSSGFLPYARNSDGNNGVLLGKRLVQETNMDNGWSELKFGMSPMDHLEINANGELLYWEGMRENSSRKVQLGQNMNWKAATFGHFGMMQAITAIRSDGTLWIFQFPMGSPFFPSTTPHPLGHRSDWVAVAPGFALASDGSIWNWEPRTAYAWLAPSRRPLSLGNIFQGSEN